MIREPGSRIRRCDFFRRHGPSWAGCFLSALICAFYVSGCCAPAEDQVATPTLDPNGGTFTGSVEVTISCVTEGATIRYTANGSDPTASSSEYAGPVTLKATTTLKARAFKDGLTDSEVASATFTVNPASGQVAAPTFSPNGGTFDASVDVGMSCATTGATIRYTTNGSDPTASSDEYAGSISLTATTTLKARAFKTGMTDSDVASATFTVNPASGQVAAPTISPNGGTFLQVTFGISSATSGATIRYTLDGSTPTSSHGMIYAGGVPLTASATVRAIAYKADMTDSAVASATFLITSTTRVSVTSAGAQGNGESIRGSITPDGRYVAFDSVATNLANGDTNGKRDVFVHDYKTGQTLRVSLGTGSLQGNGDSYLASISADGRYVAFQSDAGNLVASDTNGLSDVFVHDRQTSQTTRVSVAWSVFETDGTSGKPSITGDGRYVAFHSAAKNLAMDQTDSNFDLDVFVRDRQTGVTTRISDGWNGTAGDDHSYEPSISEDGRYVAFVSSATNLVTGDTNLHDDVFVYDRQTHQTERISVSTGSAEGNDDSGHPSISSDGRYVAFQSAATNLVNADSNNWADVFVHDRQLGVTTRVSLSSGLLEGNGNSSQPSISSDGRYVVFSTLASNLTLDDLNGVSDVLVHDRQTAETTRVSVNWFGAEADNGSSNPSISSDGRYVAFASYAANMVDGDTNGTYDVFVRDRGQ